MPPRSSPRAQEAPAGQAGTREGVVLAYHTGVKMDGVWHPFAPSYARVDVRSGDRALIELDVAGAVTRLEILERGNGKILMTEPQRNLIRERCDLREKSLEDFEREVLQPWFGMSVAQLENWAAKCLIPLFLNREPQRPERRGRR